MKPLILLRGFSFFTESPYFAVVLEECIVDPEHRQRIVKGNV